MVIQQKNARLPTTNSKTEYTPEYCHNNEESTFSFKSSEASMLPFVSGSGTKLEAMFTCSWRESYRSKTVSRRNLSPPW